LVNSELIKSIDTLIKYYSNDNLADTILDLQRQLINKNSNNIISIANRDSTNKDIFSAALEVKEVMGQINVIVHTLGIINILPIILDKDEIIESVSLGADNAHSEFDLITNKRIAEFKFITWRGKDSMRLKNTFSDYFELVEFDTKKDRYLYLIETSNFIKFLNGRRQFSSILSRNVTVSKKFYEKYKDKYNYVNEYYYDNINKVQIVALKDIAPNLFK
jgi:hypothetical protein